MPSLFREMWIKNRPHLDHYMAEPLTIVFMVRGEFEAARPDAANPPFIANGIVIIEDLMAMAGSVMVGTAERTDMVMAAPEVTFLPVQFGGAGRPAPVEGTRIIRHTWPGSPTYALITPPLVDSVGQLCCRLAPVLEGLNYWLGGDSGVFGVVGWPGTMTRVL